MTVIGAVWSCWYHGQRCTSTRCLIIHESIYDKERCFISAYGQFTGNPPLDENNHVGPLIDTHAVQMYNHALAKVVAEGGKIIVEGGVLSVEVAEKWLLCKTSC
jgi:aldehyde dehydrogenase (NAD+)